MVPVTIARQFRGFGVETAVFSAAETADDETEMSKLSAGRLTALPDVTGLAEGV